MAFSAKALIAPGVVLGGALLGAGMNKMSDYLDRSVHEDDIAEIIPTGATEAVKMGKWKRGTDGKAVRVWYKRTSTYTDVVGGLAIAGLGAFLVKQEALRLFLVSFGASAAAGRIASIIEESSREEQITVALKGPVVGNLGVQRMASSYSLDADEMRRDRSLVQVLGR